jgi:hypothetical protein
VSGTDCPAVFDTVAGEWLGITIAVAFVLIA